MNLLRYSNENKNAIVVNKARQETVKIAVFESGSVTIGINLSFPEGQT